MARRADDPLVAFRFVLEMGALQVAGFQECTGLALETKTFDYAEGGRNSNMLKFPERGQVSSITLKRGMVAGVTSHVLFLWHKDVMTGAFENPFRRPPSGDEDVAQRLAVVLQDERGQEVRRWRLVRAFPVKWQGPDLKAGSSALAIETLVLACEGLEVA